MENEKIFWDFGIAGVNDSLKNYYVEVICCSVAVLQLKIQPL